MEWIASRLRLWRIRWDRRGCVDDWEYRAQRMLDRGLETRNIALLARWMALSIDAKIVRDIGAKYAN